MLYLLRPDSMIIWVFLAYTLFASQYFLIVIMCELNLFKNVLKKLSIFCILEYIR